MKLKYLGKLPSAFDIVSMVFNPDGTMTSIRSEDIDLETEINSVVRYLKSKIGPLVDFIAKDIFDGKQIKSQELIVNLEENVLAICDLSTKNAVLEIKATAFSNIQNYAEQLYFEANGRRCFVLQVDWSRLPQSISFVVNEVQFSVQAYVDPKARRFENARRKIEIEDISLLSFIDTKIPVKLKCGKCGNEWSTSYNLALKHRPCPECGVKEARTQKQTNTTEQGR